LAKLLWPSQLFDTLVMLLADETEDIVVNQKLASGRALCSVIA